MQLIFNLDYKVSAAKVKQKNTATGAELLALMSVLIFTVSFPEVRNNARQRTCIVFRML